MACDRMMNPRAEGVEAPPPAAPADSTAPLQQAACFAAGGAASSAASSHHRRAAAVPGSLRTRWRGRSGVRNASQKAFSASDLAAREWGIGHHQVVTRIKQPRRIDRPRAVGRGPVRLHLVALAPQRGRVLGGQRPLQQRARCRSSGCAPVSRLPSSGACEKLSCNAARRR